MLCFKGAAASHLAPHTQEWARTPFCLSDWNIAYELAREVSGPTELPHHTTIGAKLTCSSK